MYTLLHAIVGYFFLLLVVRLLTRRPGLQMTYALVVKQFFLLAPGFGQGFGLEFKVLIQGGDTSVSACSGREVAAPPAAVRVGELLGPLTLGRLFDKVGRKPMITATSA